MRRIYDLFVSGGKDSVVAATVTHRKAKGEGVEARVVYIDELKAFGIPRNLLEHDPLEYVKRFASWLGVDVLVLESDFDYWEGVKRWGYPLIFDKRWCFDFLKKRPLERLVVEERREGLQAIWVTGIRRVESQRRGMIYRSNKSIIKVGGSYVEYYHPILDWTDDQVERFIRDNGIPENPLWRLGFSFECLCMAGMSITKLDRMIEEAPRLVMWLAERDREVQEARRRGPAYVNPLLSKRIPLCEYVKMKMEQKKILDF